LPYPYIPYIEMEMISIKGVPGLARTNLASTTLTSVTVKIQLVFGALKSAGIATKLDDLGESDGYGRWAVAAADAGNTTRRSAPRRSAGH
jgi:hypothetical protein